MTLLDTEFEVYIVCPKCKKKVRQREFHAHMKEHVYRFFIKIGRGEELANSC